MIPREQPYQCPRSSQFCTGSRFFDSLPTSWTKLRRAPAPLLCSNRVVPARRTPPHRSPLQFLLTWVGPATSTTPATSRAATGKRVNSSFRWASPNYFASREPKVRVRRFCYPWSDNSVPSLTATVAQKMGNSHSAGLTARTFVRNLEGTDAAPPRCLAESFTVVLTALRVSSSCWDGAQAVALPVSSAGSQRNPTLQSSSFSTSDSAPNPATREERRGRLWTHVTRKALHRPRVPLVPLESRGPNRPQVPNRGPLQQDYRHLQRLLHRCERKSSKIRCHDEVKTRVTVAHKP